MHVLHLPFSTFLTCCSGGQAGFTPQSPAGGSCDASGTSELVPGVCGLAEFLHGHDLDDEAGPAGKVLRALALARLRVVLLPGESRLFPAAVDCVDQVAPEAVEEVRGLGSEGAVLRGHIL